MPFLNLSRHFRHSSQLQRYITTLLALPHMLSQANSSNNVSQYDIPTISCFVSKAVPTHIANIFMVTIVVYQQTFGSVTFCQPTMSCDDIQKSLNDICHSACCYVWYITTRLARLLLFFQDHSEIFYEPLYDIDPLGFLTKFRSYFLPLGIRLCLFPQLYYFFVCLICPKGVATSSWQPG